MQDDLPGVDWLRASRLSARQGRHAEGADQARRAIASQDSGEAMALLALHKLRLGNIRACLATGQAAVNRLLETGPSSVLAEAECTLAVACLQAEFMQQALVHAQRGAEAADRSGDAAAIAWSCSRLAQAHMVLGHVDRANRLFDEAYDQATRLGDTSLLFSILYNRAWAVLDPFLRGTLADPGPLGEALRLLEQAQGFADADENLHSQGICLLNRSRCLQGLDRPQESEALARSALAIGQSNRLTQLVVGAQTVLSEWMLRDGRAEAALEALLAVRRDVSDADLISQVDLLRPIVVAQRALGRYEAALDALGELHSVAMKQAQARADLQAWMLIHQHEIDREREAAQRAALDAEVQRLRAARWEAEAHHDPLTGLANRRFVAAQMSSLLEHGRQQGLPLLAAMLDIDHFKSINDRFGHAVGDEVLRATADLVRTHLRPRDVCARVGGEEFLLLLPECHPEQAWAACERLRRQIAAHDWSLVAAGLCVTVSIGLAPVGSPESPWEAADTALYAAKSGGRDRVMQAT